MEKLHSENDIRIIWADADWNDSDHAGRNREEQIKELKM